MALIVRKLRHIRDSESYPVIACSPRKDLCPQNLTISSNSLQTQNQNKILLCCVKSLQQKCPCTGACLFWHSCLAGTKAQMIQDTRTFEDCFMRPAVLLSVAVLLSCRGIAQNCKTAVSSEIQPSCWMVLVTNIEGAVLTLLVLYIPLRF